MSTPRTTIGSGSLRKVFNQNEANLGLVDNGNSINDIANKEFQIDFTGPNTFTVSTDGGNGSFNDTLEDQNGNTGLNINEDHQLFLPTAAPNNTTPGAADLGLTISADDFAGSFVNNDQIQFTVTESRSTGSDGRSFGIVGDGDGNDTALFFPEENGGAISFGPNLNDTSGILDEGPPFSNLLAGSGSAGNTQQKADAEIQALTSSDVFDSQGDQNTLTYRFEKQTENRFLFHALDPTPTNTDEPKLAGFGTLEFTENGQLANSEIFSSRTAGNQPPPGPAGDLDQNSIVFNPPPETLQSDPSAEDSVNPDVGAEPVSITPDFSNVTQFAGASDIQIEDQDGSSQGRLQSLSFNSSGTVNGAFDNGESRELAQVSLATFRNPAGLEGVGDTFFAESANSGIPQVGQPGLGARGSITPGALERSNVDLNDEFTRILSIQRGFQANTRTITTADQLIQSTLQLI